MIRFLLFCICCAWGFMAQADCPIADDIARSQSLSNAIPIYTNCALQENDDASQIYLARIYAKGQGDVAKNMSRALLFYHLSAENGNASAMVALSQLLTELDATDVGRMEVLKYWTLIRYSVKNNRRSSFQGEILHPYALLALASESPESKWFYLSPTKTDENAARLMKSYEADKETKQKALKQATYWKQRKMLDIAREVLTVPEYPKFYNTLYPKSGIKDPFARSQAINQLKEKLESKRK